MPLYKAELPLTAPVTIARPRVFIPVFPGINCEYDSARAFEDAGAVAETFIVRNLTPQAVEESVAKMVEMIDNAQIVMLPGGFSAGGFSAGDEPDGSGKFIATMLRNPRIKEAIGRLLNDRDGLMLGICNGFQALVKLGLVPYGEIREMKSDSPTLTFPINLRGSAPLNRAKFTPLPYLTAKAASMRRKKQLKHCLPTGRLQRSMLMKTANLLWQCRTTPMVRCMLLKALPAPTAEFWVKWAIPNVLYRACLKTSAAIKTRKSLSAA